MKGKCRKQIAIMLATFIIILYITLPAMAKENNIYGEIIRTNDKSWLHGMILGSSYTITLSLIAHLIMTWKKRNTINKKRLIIITTIYSIMAILFLFVTIMLSIITTQTVYISPDGTTQTYTDSRNWWGSLTVFIEVIFILSNKYFKYIRTKSENKEEIKKIMFYYLLGALIYTLPGIMQKLFG